jgi:hypothetical protein
VGENESLAHLSGQLAEVRTGLAEVRTRMVQFGARLDTETGPVIVLQTEVKKLREKVDDIAGKLAAAQASGGDEPSAPRWDGRGPGAEAGQLAGLRSWVDEVLRVQYPGYLRSLPPCWPGHREALWELGTLQAEWTRVYGGDATPLADAQWWHERWLPGTLTRLKTAITCDTGGCSLQPRQNRAQAPDFSGTSRDPRIAASFPGHPRPRG